MPKKEKVLYMVIDTSDDKELPLYVGTLEEVAQWCNVTPNAISSAICHAKQRKQVSKYVKVNL